MIDRKIKLVLLYCCTIRNRNGVIALNANVLVEKIIENGYTIRDISNLLGVSKDDLAWKLNDVAEFTIGETYTLKSMLSLSDSEAINIFLGA